MKRSLRERFEEKYTPDPMSDCWIWTAGKFAQGYGLIKVNNKLCKAHRVSYELYKGPIPKGLCVMHQCDMPNCVNPNHLIVGTLKDNTQDMLSKGRGAKVSGERHWNAKLSREWVRQIQLLYNSGKFSQTLLAMFYGISQAQVSNVVTNKTWNKLIERMEDE